MRGARLGAATTVAAMTVGLAVAAPSPQAAAIDQPAITALALWPPAVRVVGLTGSVAVTLTLTVHDPTGIRVCNPVAFDPPFMRAVLTRTAGGSAVKVALTPFLGNGGLRDGTWTATWNVSSARAGTWAVTSVSWCGGEAVDIAPTTVPGLSPGLIVTGVGAPTMTFARTPSVVAYRGRQWGVVTFRDGSGRPMADRQVNAGSGSSCTGVGANPYMWSPLGNVLARTDARGRFTWRLYGVAVPSSIGCWWLLTGPSPVVRSSTTVLFSMADVRPWTRFAAVSVGVAAPLSRRSRTAALVGTTSPAASAAAVVAQGRVAGRWRTVATGTTSAAPPYRYRLAVPLATSEQAVRVVARSASFAATASRVITLPARRRTS